MRKYLLALLASFSFQLLAAQHPFEAFVFDARNNTPITGVRAWLPALKTGAFSDSLGKITLNEIPDSTYLLEFSMLGYKTLRTTIRFPYSKLLPRPVFHLEASGLSLDAVVVTSTRTNNRIEEIPIRVEVLGSEEVNEEIEMKPGNITKLLGETSGIQTQQTSATSGSMSFRILGLPGKYTQLLKDGFPIYSGFSSGLSLVQIPPLDLKQVEIIKGTSPALYGGDAIAGIVNLISKIPGDSAEWNILLNQTHKGGSDASTFFSGRKKKLGLTFLATGSNQLPVDVDGDGFSDIPRLQLFTIKPKLFYYIDSSSTLTLAMSHTQESRSGGDMQALNNKADSLHSFFEKQISERNSAEIQYQALASGGNIFTVKSTLNYFKRTINSSGNYSFGGEQVGSYSEVSYLFHMHTHTLVAGSNFTSDVFNQTAFYSYTNLSYINQSAGIFLQDDWKLGSHLQIESGIRADEHFTYGSFFLPRISAMYTFNRSWYLRLGGGLGYKAPTVFSEEAEAMHYQNVFPLYFNPQAERSGGAGLDVNFRHALGDKLVLSLNQAFNYTEIRQALVPQSDSLSKGLLYFTNVPAGILALGAETNLKLKMDEAEFALGYTFLDVRKQYEPGHPALEFTPRNRLVMSLVFGEENDWRIGFEEFYTSSQLLPDGSTGRAFWITGAIAQKTVKRFTFVANVENLFDVRQSRFAPVVLPPYSNPVFRPLYAPIDGVVFNIALKIRIY
jgi:outer membrane receptor for ferrienterochelin and colicins